MFLNIARRDPPPALQELTATVLFLPLRYFTFINHVLDR